MPDVLLSCDAVQYAYLERYLALDKVSLEVRRGQSLALLGANGCGKSTLLRLLAGLLFPDTGRYRAFGEEVTEDKLEDEQFAMAFRSRVGFVFQNSDAQVFSPTVREEIAFGPLQLGRSDDEVRDRIDDVMRMLGIAALADRAPYRLSGGEKKRVALASVLAMNPGVLLLDEPLAGLDPRTSDWFLELLLELRSAGKTLIMATHDLDLLELLADRCLVFSERHRIVTDGAPAEVLADGDTLRSANLIHAHKHRHGDVEHIHAHQVGHHHEHRGTARQAGSPDAEPAAPSTER
jgi:cobalt/nickel transport system ATP-binding protein